jgi:hypothetical protein
MRLPKPDLSYGTAAEAIITAMDGNADFPNAAGLIAAAKPALKTYLAAIAARAAKQPDAVKIRKDARRALHKLLNQLRDNAQTAVDNDVEHAEALAASAKMSIRRVSGHNKEPFEVRDGKVSGEVLLIAKAILGALTYYWELSLDSKNWSPLPETSKAHTTSGGLTPGQLYYFRFRAHTRKGMTNWLTASLLVR